MKYLWSIIAGITVILYRRWFGFCLVLSVLAIGFKGDIVQLIREDRVAEQQRIDHERNVELERIKTNAMVEAKRLELQAEENKRAEEKRIQEEKEHKKRIAAEAERQRLTKMKGQYNRLNWLAHSIQHARRYNVDVVQYDDGSSRTVQSLMAEKKKIEEEITGKIPVKYTTEPQTISTRSSVIDQKINEAKCEALKEEYKNTLYCIANPGSVTTVYGPNSQGSSCYTIHTSRWEQIAKASYNQILNKCQSNS